MSMDFSLGSSGGGTPSSTPGSTPSTTRRGSTVPAASIPGNGRPTRRAPAPRKSPPEIPNVIMTSEKGLSVLDAGALYKELTDVESGFRQLKDVLAMRPIDHPIEQRVRAHIFVAALALLVQRLLGRRLKEAGGEPDPARAVTALV